MAHNNKAKSIILVKLLPDTQIVDIIIPNFFYL